MPPALIDRFTRLPYRWPIVIVLATVLVITFLFSSSEKPKPSKARQNEWSVRTMPVAFNQHSVEATLYGRVETPSFVSLASPVTAYIKDAKVLEGEAVQQGDLLVAMDIRDQQLVVAQREADVVDMEARLKSEQLRAATDQKALEQEKILLENSEKERQRQLILKEKNLISESHLETAISNLARQQLVVLGREQSVNDADNRKKQMEAQLERSRALLQQAQLDLERSQIRAPFSGRISSLKVANGERVRTGDPVIEMFDTEQLEVRAQIPDRYLSVVRRLIKSKKKVLAQLQVSDGFIPLELNRLAASVDSGRGGVDAMFRLADGQAQNLVYGRAQIIELQVPLSQQAVQIPPDALYRDSYIYRIDKNSRLEAVEVQHLGDMSANGREWLLVSGAGLQEGDEILVTRIASAISGMQVSVKEKQKQKQKSSSDQQSEAQL